MIDSLYEIFLRLGHTWKISGIMSSPTKSDLEKVIDRAKEILYAEPIPSQIEIPGLLIRRSDTETISIYVKIGDTL